MKGTLKRFDGLFGYINGEDGKVYFFHRDEIALSVGETLKKRKNRIGHRVGKMVEFDIGERYTESGELREKPRALEIRFTPEPPEPERAFICPACGKLSPSLKAKFCMYCGAAL